VELLVHLTETAIGITLIAIGVKLFREWQDRPR
jgi:hypothetical protein